MNLALCCAPVSGNRRDPIASSGIFPGLWHMNVRQLGRSELGHFRTSADAVARSALPSMNGHRQADPAGPKRANNGSVL
jgi:hypothetical protein